MLRELTLECFKEMIVARDVTPADFFEDVCVNGFRLVAFPCAGEDVDFVFARMRRQRGGEAIFL